MSFTLKKNYLYDFTVDIFLMKQAMLGNESLSNVYDSAISEIKGILNDKIDFYDASSRTFDMVYLATTKYPEMFKESSNHENDLANLLKILEKNNKTYRFGNSP